MGDLSELKIEPFTAKRVRNENPSGKMTWQMFHAVRNAVVRACRRFGSTGPMGEVDLDPQVIDPYTYVVDNPDFWPRGDDNPKYRIANKPIGNDRFVVVTLHAADALSAEWLATMVATMREHRGWAIEVANIPDSSLLIFGKRLLMKGRQLGRCKDAAEVIATAARLLKQGPKQWWQFWR